MRRKSQARVAWRDVDLSEMLEQRIGVTGVVKIAREYEVSRNV